MLKIHAIAALLGYQKPETVSELPVKSDNKTPETVSELPVKSDNKTPEQKPSGYG